ncbi:hypothetical protein CEF21_19140 [Bacillus sp. FJAT-42376]|nr:hypothetical protein CEF21_19140 [Bacillus sp. FJAT-42376]
MPLQPPISVTGYTDMFHLSAREALSLFGDMQKVLTAISSSSQYAYQIRRNAEHSNTKEVTRLIRQSGLSSAFEVTYTPDGINLSLIKPHGHLTAHLRW